MEKIPTPTQQEESVVLNIPLEKVWSLFWSKPLNTYAPKKVKEVKYLTGGPMKVGSILQITYNDGAKWDLLILEISDHRHSLVYQVVKAEPSTHVSSIVNLIKFKKVSKTNQTFVKWTTQFTNDADANAIADNKYKKLDFFDEAAEFIAKNKL